MPAVSKKQQKFFGIVRSVQKGEQSPTTPEVAKAASDMKKGDVKKFASTKHKGLPEKKKIEEDRQIKKIIKQLRKSVKSHDKQADTLEKKLKEEVELLSELPKWDPKGAKIKRDALIKSGGGDYTIWKPGINVPGIGKKNTLDITKGEVAGPIKDKVSTTLKVGKGIKNVGNFIAKNPGKTALIGAGVIGAGLLAKKVLSGKKKKEVKEQTTFPQMQERIRNAKERRREQQKKSEKLYIDTKKKGVKFYDKKGVGRLKDGKKVYD